MMKGRAPQSDPRGDVIRTRYADGTETRTAYDALGRAEWTMDRFASTSTYNATTRGTKKVSGTNGTSTSRTRHGASLNARLRCFTSQYNWNGRAARRRPRHEVKVAQRKDGDPVIATHHLYDRLGRLTDVWQPAVPDAANGNAISRPHWRYAYDENGNQTLQVDPRRKETRFAYDERGRRTSRTLPPGSDNNTANDTESWTYDPRGRVDVHTDFKGQSTKHVYESDTRYGGRLKEEQRFVGAVDDTPDETTAWTYDALGRGSSVTESANLDADDNTPLQVTRTETTSYDPLTGAVIVTASPEGVVRHTYDPATGRLLGTWTAPDQTSIADVAAARTSAHTLTEFEYNYLGQLWKVKAVRLNGGAVPAARQATSYTYDAVGNQETLALPNGVTTTYTYDALSRLDTLTAKRGPASCPPGRSPGCRRRRTSRPASRWR